MLPRLFVASWLVVVRLTFLFSWHTSSPFAFITNPRLYGASHRPVSVVEMEASNGDTNGTTPDSSPSAASVMKRLICIRHGISTANEWMSQPGNEWGDPNFREDGKPDAPLSETGRLNTVDFLEQQFREQPPLLQALDEVELVLLSPLTRCIETFHYGVEPILMDRLQKIGNNKAVPILALPLLRERVYTTSDTGRAASVLSKEFPTVDFSECPDGPWWYSGIPEGGRGTEWRPHGQNQWYGVPGEPQDVFEARMTDLDEWIASRRETTILMVAHWGVLLHLTNGTHFANAEVKILEHSFCPQKRESKVTHL